MNRRNFTLLALSNLAVLCVPRLNMQSAFAQNSNEYLILLSAPQATDSYYAEIRKDILAFCADFVRKSAEKAIILCDVKTYDEMQLLVSADNLMQADIKDIWIRDFFPIQVKERLLKFSYRPSYLSKTTAKAIEDSCLRWFEKKGLHTEQINLILDGSGNFVWDGESQAISTERILKDNRALSKEKIVKEIKDKFGLKNFVLIPEEKGDVLGHADGMVKWLDPKTLLLASFKEPFRRQIIKQLEKELPEVEIVEVPYPFVSKTWRGFADATGVYLNIVDTPKTLYVPSYDLPQDKLAVSIIASKTKKKLVISNVSKIAKMGGAVNCLTNSYYGTIAKSLLEK